MCTSPTPGGSARRWARRRRWYRCDLLDTPHELDGTADLVYTGRGALCWLHDLDGWAAVIARLLKPGGILSVFDDHPVNWLFEMDTETLVATGYDYFTHSESSQGWPATYIGELDVPVAQQARKYERLWPLSAIFGALRGAGLVVEYFGEHRDEYWDGFPKLKPELKATIPMTFSMIARTAGRDHAMTFVLSARSSVPRDTSRHRSSVFVTWW